MPKEQKDEIPFKTMVSGVKCVTIARSDSVLLDFTEYKKTVDIPHSAIRCIQQRGKTLIVSTQKEDRLLSYLIFSSSSKRLYDAIINSMSC